MLLLWISTRCSTRDSTILSLCHRKRLCRYDLCIYLISSGVRGGVRCDAGDVFQVLYVVSLFRSVQEMNFFSDYTARWEGYMFGEPLILERSTSSSTTIQRSLNSTPSFWTCARVALGRAAFPMSGKATFFRSTN